MTDVTTTVDGEETYLEPYMLIKRGDVFYLVTSAWEYDPNKITDPDLKARVIAGFRKVLCDQSDIAMYWAVDFPKRDDEHMKRLFGDATNPKFCLPEDVPSGAQRD